MGAITGVLAVTDDPVPPRKKIVILLIYFKWLGTYLLSRVCAWEEEAREENVMQNLIHKEQ